MRTVLRIIVYVPLALVILFFAMANRAPVTIHLDPLAGAESAAGPSFQAPLFLIVLASMAAGVLAGGLSSWLRHHPVRRAAKVAVADAKKARGEVEQLRQQALASLPTDTGGTDGRRSGQQ